MRPWGGFRTEQAADRLIARFGSAAGVLAASPDALARDLGPLIGPWLASVRQSIFLASVENMLGRHLTSSSDHVIALFQASMGGLRVEQAFVLYLNSQNYLIRCEEAARGTIDTVKVHPREIVRRALELGASALIIVHNHPSGSQEPSRADIRLTRALAEACKLFTIELHDHVIVAAGGHTSLRALGLL